VIKIKGNTEIMDLGNIWPPKAAKEVRKKIKK
jgi:hypothetical protein